MKTKENYWQVKNYWMVEAVRTNGLQVEDINMEDFPTLEQAKESALAVADDYSDLLHVFCSEWTPAKEGGATNTGKTISLDLVNRTWEGENSQDVKEGA